MIDFIIIALIWIAAALALVALALALIAWVAVEIVANILILILDLIKLLFFQ